MCKSTSAGAVQLEYYGIEAWSVVQQVVSFSSDENESYATEMLKADRWETLGHRWNQILWSGAYPETRAKGVAEQTIQAVEKVPGNESVDSTDEFSFSTERNMKAKARTWRVVASARQKIPASIWRLSRRCHEWAWTGFFARSTDADLVMNTMWIQKSHNVVENHQ